MIWVVFEVFVFVSAWRCLSCFHFLTVFSFLKTFSAMLLGKYFFVRGVYAKIFVRWKFSKLFAYYKCVYWKSRKSAYLSMKFLNFRVIQKTQAFKLKTIYTQVYSKEYYSQENFTLTTIIIIIIFHINFISFTTRCY